MTNPENINKNYATQILWDIINKYHNGNCAACARKMLTTNQRLCYILGKSLKITPRLGAKLRYFYPNEKIDWNTLMLPYDVNISNEMGELKETSQVN